jgi:hypothetical protein
MNGYSLDSELVSDDTPVGQTDDGISPVSPSTTDVFGYEDYRAYMRDRFAELQTRKPDFSQRGLARKARIANPGFFNEVIKGRRRLSHSAAVKMAVGLELSPAETEYFSALVDYFEAREPLAKLRAGRWMMALKNRRLRRTLHTLPSSTETLNEIMRELEADWVLQAAGLSIDHAFQAGPTTVLDPMGESTLREILEKLVYLRAQAEADPDSQVVRFSLQMAPRMAKPQP